jgi:hypothetical protein
MNTETTLRTVVLFDSVKINNNIIAFKYLLLDFQWLGDKPLYYTMYINLC